MGAHCAYNLKAVGGIGAGSREGFQGVALGSALCQAASKHYETITSMTCLNNSPSLTLLLLPFPLPHRIRVGVAKLLLCPRAHSTRLLHNLPQNALNSQRVRPTLPPGGDCKFLLLLLLLLLLLFSSGRKSPERKATKTFTQKRSRARAVKGIKRTVDELHSVHVQAAFIKITVLKYALSKLQLSSTTTYNMPHATLNKQKSQDVERGGEYTKTGTEQCGNLKRGRREEGRMIEKGREGRRKG